MIAVNSPRCPIPTYCHDQDKELTKKVDRLCDPAGSNHFGQHRYRRFFYIRDGLSNLWQEIAVLQMERAAQRLEIRLNNPINLIESFARAGREPAAEEIQGWLLKELQRQDGVDQVRLTWQGSEKVRGRVVKAASPIYFYPEQTDALGLRSDLLDDAGQPVGRIEVQVKFDSLMQDLLVSGWMQTNNACL